METDVRVARLGRERSLTHDILVLSSATHHIHGLIEVDVTEARRRLRGLSFTAFVIHCVATAVAAEPRFNAVRRGRRVYSFHTVNVGAMVETEENGVKNPVGVIIREAERKSVAEIHTEIRKAQRQPTSELARQTGAGWIVWVPGFVRRSVMRLIMRSPAFCHRMGLVIGVTAVGMFGRGAGWGIPITPCTLSVTVGGIGRRPALVHGRLEDHEFVCLTLSIDHDLIDGAPAARFSGRLARLMEEGDGLVSAAA